jgi:hypothetical protein
MILFLPCLSGSGLLLPEKSGQQFSSRTPISSKIREIRVTSLTGAHHPDYHNFATTKNRLGETK